MPKINNKILFLINGLGAGGAEHVFIAQANALYAQGVDVSLALVFPFKASHAPIRALLQLPAERVCELNFRTLYDAAGYRRLATVLKERRIDLVYSTLNEANIVARVIALWPAFRSLRLMQREANSATRKPLKFKLFDALTFWRVKRIISLSRDTSQSLVRYLPQYQKKVVELLNGVIVPPVPTDAAAEPQGKIRIAHIGSLTEQKNQSLLLDAIARIKAERVQVELQIVGVGVLESELRAQATRLGIMDQVIFRGYVSRTELPTILLSSQIYIQTSRWEGCPNALLEGMAYGLACIATSVGATPELINTADCGRLIPSHDLEALVQALGELVASPELRSRLGTQARARILSNFSQDQHLKKFFTLLDEVVSGGVLS